MLATACAQLFSMGGPCMDETAQLPDGRQTGSYPAMSLPGNLQTEIVLLINAARQKRK